MRRFLGLAPLVMIAGFLACTGEDPVLTGPAPKDAPDGSTSAPDASGGESDAATSEAPVLSIADARPRVRIGGSVDVDLTIDRKGLAGEVAVTVSGLPNGVTATALPIAADATKTKITLAATAAAATGAAPFAVSAAGASLAATIVVAGNPGTYDTTFDGDGVVLDTGNATRRYDAVLPLPDGGVVVAGATDATGTWIVRRFKADGSADAAFDAAAAPILPTTGRARGLALDAATGKIVVVGESGSTLLVTVLRLNANGAPDQAFASAGVFTTTLVEHSQGSTAASAVVLADSSIVIAGAAYTKGYAQKLTAAGVKDTGWVTYNVDNVELRGIALLPSGAFIAGGTDSSGSPKAQLAVRLLANGSPDLAFNVAGARSYASGCRGDALASTKDGDGILVGGDTTSPSVCTTRFAASGNGTLTWTKKTNIASSGGMLGASGAGDDASYGAGWGGGTYDKWAFMERRTKNGDLDTTFGSSGAFRVEDTANTPDTFVVQFHAAARTADGQILLSGTRTGTVSPGAVLMRIWE